MLLPPPHWRELYLYAETSTKQICVSTGFKFLLPFYNIDSFDPNKHVIKCNEENDLKDDEEDDMDDISDDLSIPSIHRAY